MRRALVVLTVLLIALGGVACSQDEARDVAGDTAEEVEDAAKKAADAAEDAADRAEDVANDRTVNIDDFTYEPERLEVTRGTEVTWVNQDDVPHTVTEDDDGAFESEQLEEGDEFSHRFVEEGTFTYHCEVHGEDRMSATVVVEG